MSTWILIFFITIQIPVILCQFGFGGPDADSGPPGFGGSKFHGKGPKKSDSSEDSGPPGFSHSKKSKRPKSRDEDEPESDDSPGFGSFFPGKPGHGGMGPPGSGMGPPGFSPDFMPTDFKPPDFSNGLFVFDCISMFFKKGMFFGTPEEKDKTPFNYEEPTTSVGKPKSKPKNKKVDTAFGDDEESLETILTIYEFVISDSPHRAHPFYLKRDAAGLDPYAVIGDILSVTVTTAILICGKGYHVEIELAVYTFWWIVQRLLVHQIRILIGYPNGDGVMIFGECLANLKALELAMSVKCPLFAAFGFTKLIGGGKGNGSPALLVSEGNYEVQKIIFGLFSGIPDDYIVRVAMDEEGRMDPADLERKIKESKGKGMNPVMVIAQVGSTTLGAVDPIEAIVKITEKYKIWLHIDGTHGGPCLFSNDIKEKWKGVERSNSFAFSFASLLGVPYPASFLITRDDGIFKSLFDIEKLKTYLASHIGMQLMQSPKITDAGKTWLMWFIKGYRGLRQHVEYAYNLTKLTRKHMRKRPMFKLLTTESDTPLVAFRVIPSNLKDKDSNIAEMDKFTKDLKFRLLLQGFVYISTKRRLPGEPKHFMFPLSNSIMTEPDILYVLDTIECHANDLAGNKKGQCSELLSKRINQLSPMAMSKDGYVPYVNALMPDLHIPFFKGMFELFFKGGNPDNKKDKAVDLALGEFGMKKKDVMPFMGDFMGMFTQIPKGNDSSSPTPGSPFPFQGFQDGFKMFDKGNIVTLMADFLTSFMSPSMNSKESSPPFESFKEELEKYIRTKVGYPNGDGDAITVSADGSTVTLYTVTLARYYKQSKKKIGDKTLVMYMSTEGFWTWIKAAGNLGIGMDNCRYIPVDSNGEMDVAALRKAIKEDLDSGDKEPFLVVSTLGSDVLGAVDNFNEIRSVCDKYDLWFHIDGYFGGPLIFSKRYKKKLGGIENSDSFSFSPRRFYKGESMKFAIVVTKYEGIFDEVFKPKNNKTADEDEDDPRSPGSRSSDEFKYWINLKSEGLNKVADRIDGLMDSTQTGIKIMKTYPSFNLVLPAFSLTSICFVYTPKEYKEELGPEVLDGIQIQLEGILKENRVPGVYYTNSTVYENGNHGFLKIDITDTNEDDLKYVISKIEKYGADMECNAANSKKARDERAKSDEENIYAADSPPSKVSASSLTKKRKSRWSKTKKVEVGSVEER